jgi:hypothetical protein
MALDIITEFAKYGQCLDRPIIELIIYCLSAENTRSSMIQPTSWIVYELLTMLRVGSTEIDRCQVGLKGLLALGLF